MSSFGWTYLSRDALRRAEAQLAGEAAGVRDEIGFLIIHQRYADQFFPGTSVLHTRLRYALFVPWLYQHLRQRPTRGRIDAALQKAEVDLAGRLRNAEGGGAVGGNNYPKPTSQPPSVIYWTALGAWGLLRPRADGRLPSRAQLHVLLQSRARPAFDDDGQPLSSLELPFSPLPSPPKNWDGDSVLDFALTPSEATFLFSQISNIPSPAVPARKSLFARLAASCAVHARSCWDPAIVSLAEQDAAALRRAGDVASLAAVGRAVYAALVETLKEEIDKRPTSRKHRDYLPRIVGAHASIASRVKLDSLLEDVGSVPETLVDVLRKTLAWLASGANNPMDLRMVYERAECARKDQRARLAATLNGRDRRLEWNNEEHSLAEPLHYRWDNVSRLLNDLWTAA
jgi:Family of unknown function (DUF6361)